MTRAASRPPADLTPVQLSLWRGMKAARYEDELDAPDALRLRLIVDATKRLDEVRAALDGAELLAAGSTGQPAPHPLLAVESSLRAEVRSALKDWQL